MRRSLDTCEGLERRGCAEGCAERGRDLGFMSCSVAGAGIAALAYPASRCTSLLTSASTADARASVWAATMDIQRRG
jgi:hypothetical protein